MSRQGDVDPWSGQRAAFPLDNIENSEAIEYLRRVRNESQALMMNRITLKRTAPSQPPRTRIEQHKQHQTQGLEYDEVAFPLTEVVKQTNELFGRGASVDLLVPVFADRGRSGSSNKMAELYRSAYREFAGLQPQHPEECTSLATWKSYMTANAPIPVNHMDTFRLYKYLAKWCSHEPPANLFLWAWSLLVRTQDVLDGDEISVLRDLCRALERHSEVPLAAAFRQVVGNVFGQSDMLE